MADGMVNPYQFEPDITSTSKKLCAKKLKTLEKEPEIPRDSLSDESWCQCGKCPPTQLVKEKVCCAHLHTVQNIHGGHLCVTDNDVFSGVCLYEPVLRMNYFMQRYNENARVYRMCDPIASKSYRYCAYQTFTFWSQGRLGRFNRRVIPACIIHTVRTKYPDINNTYVGYKEADEVDEIDGFI